MSAIESFIKKTDAATKARSKEIRISLQEAQILVMEMSGLLESENKLLKKINDLQSNVPVVATPSGLPTGEVVMDGGSFKK